MCFGVWVCRRFGVLEYGSISVTVSGRFGERKVIFDYVVSSSGYISDGDKGGDADI